MMTETRGSSNAEAKRELGCRPRYPRWRDGFRNGLTKGDAAAPPDAKRQRAA
jgi:2-alkyl-3-oxoalkanoate reductase